MVVGCCGHAVTRLFQFGPKLEYVGHLFCRHICLGRLGLSIDAFIEKWSWHIGAVCGRCRFLRLDRTPAQVVRCHFDGGGPIQRSIHFHFAPFLDCRSQKNGGLRLWLIHVALCHVDDLELCLSTIKRWGHPVGSLVAGDFYMLQCAGLVHLALY